ncbi:helix-turn-helix domain-containing protein [Haloarcula onubensis]|uniref:Helix-turn-helix domain-containing protein n=1 Tax=Haloarcula onubensis TaxID=2950539 RepID=A0ABU2FWH9_9EURY|nr:helix-turn-helix domain-containing protein [Halomicroarcula sp. S3CR25-11]MDS0284591.1 helix-turn-helix domain-containing protein [Halomicroarcula sp. S3CR25-11]
MSTIVQGSVPSDELALHRTFQELPELEVQCERVVKSGENTVFPVLWMRDATQEAIEDALADDPTVESVECLSSLDEEYLYEMEWIDHVHLLLNILTNGEATILDAVGRRDRWHLRVLFPDREHFARTHEFAEDHGLAFDVRSIRELEGEPAGRYGLTEGQYEALILAADRGYFEVSRETTLEELADELDVSHQALSEQLRRGMEALVEDTLFVGEMADEIV